MDELIEDVIVYPNLKAAAAAVCSKWCQQQDYTNHFYSNGSWWAFPPQGVLKFMMLSISKELKPDEFKLSIIPSHFQLLYFPMAASLLIIILKYKDCLGNNISQVNAVELML